jgi:hypothetical protein
MCGSIKNCMDLWKNTFEPFYVCVCARALTQAYVKLETLFWFSAPVLQRDDFELL